MANEEEVKKPEPTSVPEAIKAEPVVSKPAGKTPSAKAKRAPRAAKKDPETQEYVPPEWSVTVTELLGTERVSIKPFGWVGGAAIITSVEKAHSLGTILTGLKSLTKDDEGENIIVK